MSNEALQQTVVPPELLLDPASAPAPEPTKVEQQAPSPNPADEIPEQFRGKSPAELVKIIRDSQSEIGRARNEIGQVRRLADELLGIHRAGAAPRKDGELPQRKPLTTDALLSDPEAAVVQVVRAEAESREAVTAERVSRLESELQLSRLELKHPGYRETITDPAFADWVQKSALRVGLAQGAQQGNFAAADELLTLYKESRPAPANTETLNPTDRAREAGLVRSGGAAAAGSAPPADKQIWSRAALLDLRIKDPDKFDRLWPQIEVAYREKRVR